MSSEYIECVSRIQGFRNVKTFSARIIRYLIGGAVIALKRIVLNCINLLSITFYHDGFPAVHSFCYSTYALKRRSSKHSVDINSLPGLHHDFSRFKRSQHPFSLHKRDKLRSPTNCFFFRPYLDLSKAHGHIYCNVKSKDRVYALLVTTHY